MTYIDLINRFWNLNLQKHFSKLEIALHFYILHVCNISRWSERFELSNKDAMAVLDCSKNQLIYARKRLAEAGLITYYPGNLKKAVEYAICVPSVCHSSTESGPEGDCSRGGVEVYAPNDLSTNSQPNVGQKADSLIGIDKNRKDNTLSKGTVGIEEIVELYHEICPSLPYVSRLTSERQEKVQALISIYPEKRFWREYFEKVRESDWLMGRVMKRDGHIFKASFDWLTNENNVVKVIEGNYSGERRDRLDEILHMIGGI